MTDPVSGASGPARFIFASEDGSISGWNPGVPPTVPPPSSQAIIAVKPSDAVYKGIAIASTNPGDPNGDFLYATNFHGGTVDVFDSTLAPVHMPGAFTDPKLPAGYAPFGIRNIDGVIYVTYALQDSDAHDDVPGMGHGFVNAFDTAGTLLRRVASRGTLNSPWGLALAPGDFGKFSDNLLIGNFGDGRIHAYELPGTRSRESPTKRTTGSATANTVTAACCTARAGRRSRSTGCGDCRSATTGQRDRQRAVLHRRAGSRIARPVRVDPSGGAEGESLSLT